MKTIKILLLLFCLFSSIWIQGQTRIKEVFQGNNSSEPKYFTSVGGVNYFFDKQNFLYKTDGTEEGTVQLTDPNNSSFVFPTIKFVEISTVGNKLVFSAYQTNDYKGTELWVSDGTTNGTIEIKDISPGTSNSNPTEFITLENGYTVFNATVNFERQIWVTDGSEVGTQRLKDFIPGVEITVSFQWVQDSTLFMSVRNEVTGDRSAWITRGTLSSTVKLGDFILPGFVSYLNGYYYFSGGTSALGNELWRTDGTVSGTTLVKDIEPGSLDFDPREITTVNNKLVFAKGLGDNRELWQSDGTSGGTSILKDINPGPGWSQPDKFYSFNGEVFFTAADGVNGRELWKTDGTEVGTVLLKDINPLSTGTANQSFVNASGKTFQDVSNGLLYFIANDGTHGSELWRTDGTTAGTFMVSDVNSSSSDSQIDNLFYYQNEVYFTAQDPNGKQQLFVTEGTQGTTQTFLTKYGLSTLTNPYILGIGSSNELYFTAFSTAYGYELFKLSSGVVTLVKDINTETVQGFSDGDKEAFVGSTKDFAYFIMNDNQSGRELFMTDGTAANTKKISRFNDNYPLSPKPQFGSNYIGTKSPSKDSFVDYKDTLYFSFDNELRKVVGDSNVVVWSQSSGRVDQLSADGGLLQWQSRDSLFTYDGSVFNAFHIDSWNFGTPRSTKIVTIDSVSYFIFGSQLYGYEPYKLDLRNGQVQLVKDMQPGSSSLNITKLIRTDTHFFMETRGTSLWFSDGTTTGTQTLDINPTGSDRVYKTIRINDSKVLFTADDGIHGQEPWVSDGTLAGTKMIEDLGTGNSVSNASALNLGFFTAANGMAYFTGRGNLYETDGDTVKVFQSGISIETPYALNGRVYGKAYTGLTTGWEPVSANRNGNGIIGDIRVGNESSFSQSFISAETKLFFIARDGTGFYAPYVFQTCPADLVQSETISTTANITAEFSITGTQNNVIEAGHTVNYETNNFILLKPGFNAEAGAVFRAQLGSGCVE